MSFTFQHIPENWLLQGIYVEVDPSLAGTPIEDGRALMFGTMLSTGSATANEAVLVGRYEDAVAYFGAGSQLTAMVERFRENNFTDELWCVPIAEPAGGTAAGGTIVVTGPSTASGTISLYVAGRRVPVTVANGAAANTVATAIAAAINGNARLPVTAAVNGVDDTQVDVTVRWKGTTGDDVKISHSHRGVVAGEVLPAGIGLTITQPSGGAGDPDLSTALAALPDKGYDVTGNAFTDTANLDLVETEWGYGDDGRWGWRRMLWGMVYGTKRHSYANAVSFHATRNDPHVSITAMEPNHPAVPWERTGARCGQFLRSVINDPARPLHLLPEEGILAPKEVDRFSDAERNTLASNGAATSKVDAAGKVVAEAPVTTYRVNAAGLPDNGQRWAETFHSLGRVIDALRLEHARYFSRSKLGNDSDRFAPSAGAIATPLRVKAIWVAEYDRLHREEGLVENVKKFKDELQVVRDPQNADRLNIKFPPDLINQLRVTGVLAQYRLEYPASL